MNKDQLKELAQKIIFMLDNDSRDVCAYEYGIPMYEPYDELFVYKVVELMEEFFKSLEKETK